MPSLKYTLSEVCKEAWRDKLQCRKCKRRSEEHFMNCILYCAAGKKVNSPLTIYRPNKSGDFLISKKER